AKVARGLAPVLRLQQESEIDVMEACFVEVVLENEVVRLRRPDEVVDARLPEAIGDPVAAGRCPLLDQLTGGADFPPIARRHVDRDVGVAETGEELAHRVKLMTVPAGLLENADLGKPLRDQEEIALESGARRDAGELGAKVQSNPNRCARRDGSR